MYLLVDCHCYSPSGSLEDGAQCQGLGCALFTAVRGAVVLLCDVNRNVLAWAMESKLDTLVQR